ncbi:uncharacterized protein [Aegilops tauschii subsp. strangulata]|uniref:uncharacterized protein n=1 Tax=Aegilops tauschii subsp. strangulata TaxID=200361 RepID=UPI00098B7CAE|nr:uncharacterized protein LOC109775045 [Aegilops tauschii subsp. strangulata]
MRSLLLPHVKRKDASEQVHEVLQDFFFLPADGTRGGILLAWRADRVALHNPTIGLYHVSATVSPSDGSPPWWITGVYGPQAVEDKLAFVSELHELRDSIAGPWVLGGDFNMITSHADKNNGRVNHHTMGRFRRFISDHAHRDIYLCGRRYTWSNEQSNPVLVKNDRVLCTASWEAAHPSQILSCLATVTSDHCPLILHCSPKGRGKRRFRFELYWTKLNGFLETVDVAWNSRVRFTWLSEGDTNTAFLKIHAAHRANNHIDSFQVGPLRVSGEAATAQAAFEHFSSILGASVDRPFSINLETIDQRHFDMLALDQPFTEEEIWSAVKLFPAGKAPGPDGFITEFLRACWPIIKADICAAFDKLYAMNGRGFHKLNEAFLTLLPKNPDASTLTDYRPISLIHLVAKLFAKVLSLRLAPRKAQVVSVNQSAFIAGRCVHNNFRLVQQTARQLHNLKLPRLLLKLDIAKAFDIVSWPFLLEVLRHLGFGRRWCEWICILISTASSRILIHGNPGPPVDHAHGLRQGDPASPLLFLIVIDTLHSLFQHAVRPACSSGSHPAMRLPASRCLPTTWSFSATRRPRN